jgi:hypothetical protein
MTTKNNKIALYRDNKIENCVKLDSKDVDSSTILTRYAEYRGGIKAQQPVVFYTKRRTGRKG